MAKILLVEDDVAFCTMLKTFLLKKECEVDAVYTATEALSLVGKNRYDVVISDVRLPDKEGLEILQAVNKKGERTGVIMMTSYAEISMAVNAIKEGALDYIAKPFHPEVIMKAINEALKKEQSPSKPLISKKAEKTTADTYIKGASEASAKLNNYIDLVAPTNMSVLIMGESGTGKEQIAKSIHDKSKRSAAPFVAVDCGAIPRELASSEFFGHVKGSFTGAVNNKTGHFEAANGGTLFLDEIGNLNYELQVQLLRALQERKIKPVGSNEEIHVNIRVIAATNEDLFEAVKKGEFREDLYHRLNEFSIKVPALKDREEDLMIFANYFLDSANKELEKDLSGFSEKTIAAFKAYHWPGNLRELKNVVKRAVLLSEGEYISSACLPSEVLSARHESKPEENYSLFKNKNEQELILDALEKTHGNKSKAARLLSIDRKTLYNKLKQYGINL
ncbi:MAG: sigma-54 dependent transcriptional regulator [Salinimicrobium sediminis]|uniref:Two-component system, NtrC family, response regulator HydG n=2 Tax=Salinimicrobium TaxID=561367 RepID=A0A285X3U5_9FLAO|nr:sigma-54 dependent transcriptional regulator [Salinimicrobium sediminis]MDX1603079.1 sigma-54 dependent transcriptional regulator [Salinimicrobium sediminis]SOC79049.1 two-component system, NtrC family, response regulator HydG [Salinimicrobium sediminis]